MRRIDQNCRGELAASSALVAGDLDGRESASRVEMRPAASAQRPGDPRVVGVEPPRSLRLSYEHRFDAAVGN